MYALENNVCCGGSQQSQDSEPRGGGYPRVPCSRPARPGNPVQSSVDASNLTDYRKISQTKSNPQNSGIWSGSDLLISAVLEAVSCELERYKAPQHWKKRPLLEVIFFAIINKSARAHARVQFRIQHTERVPLRLSSEPCFFGREAATFRK